MGLLFTYIISVVLVQWLAYTVREYTTLFKATSFRIVMRITYIPFANGTILILWIIFLMLKRYKFNFKINKVEG